MAYIQPVQGVDYGQLLMQGLGAYRGVKGMQQQDAMMKAQGEATQRRQGMEDKRFARQEKEWEQQDKDRFAKESMLFASEIGDLPLNMQIQKVDERVANLKKQGIDSTESENLSKMLKSGDNQQVAEAQQAILQRRELGYQTNVIERPPKEAGIKPMSAYGKMAVDMGVKPGTPEFSAKVQELRGQDMKKAQTIVNVGGKKETAYEEETGKGLAKADVSEYQRVIDRGQLADESVNSLMQMKTIDVGQGKFEPLKQALGSYLEAAVPGAAKRLMDVNIAGGESFTAVSGDLVLKKMQAQKGPQTESDMKQIRTTVANLGNTPEGNEFILNSAMAAELRAQEMRDFYNQYRADNGDLKGAGKAWREKIQTVPMISSVPMTANGLPMFFWQYRQAAAERFPDKTNKEIEDMWNKDNKLLKQERKGVIKQSTSRGF